MNILIVSQYFWPENFRINDLCLELSQRGHNITVLTGLPNYPDGDIFEAYKSSPEKYNKYGDCDIVRVPIVTRGAGRGLRLLLNYVSFIVLGSLFGVFKLRKKDFDIIFVFQLSPVTSAIPAIFYRFINKKPIVMWVLDLWPESLKSVGMVRNKQVLRLVGVLVSFIYNKCDLVLVQSKSFIAEVSKYAKSKLPVKYFPNWSEEIFIFSKNMESAKVVRKNSEPFVILFAGNIGVAQDFISVLNAIKIIKKREVSVVLNVVGSGRRWSEAKDYVDKYDLKKQVRLLGRFPLEEMPKFYKEADAFLLSLKSSDIFSKTIPGKMQSYLAAGKPILAMIDGEAKELIEKSRCGLVSGAGDYVRLAENMIKMANSSNETLKKYSENAINCNRNEFDRVELISKLEKMMINLINTRDRVIKK